MKTRHWGDMEAVKLLDEEKVARMIEISSSIANRPMHHVHGIEDRIGYRFWARENEFDSDQDKEETTELSSIQTISIEEFVEQAREVDFTLEDLHQAEEEIVVLFGTKEHTAPARTLVKWIIDDLMLKNKPRPWVGPLLTSRKSPRRTFGDAILKAKVLSLSRNKGSIRFAQPSSSPLQSSATGHGANSQIWGIRIGVKSYESLNSKPNKNQSCGPTSKRPMLCPSPNSSYHPTLGLVVLFSRIGTVIGNPRAPHTSKSRVCTAFSYMDFARQSPMMENGGSANQRCSGGFYRPS
jgi:hypothetical protein